MCYGTVIKNTFAETKGLLKPLLKRMFYNKTEKEKLSDSFQNVK